MATLNGWTTSDGVASNSNKVTLSVPAGETVNGQTFIASGTYTIEPTYFAGPAYARQSLSWGAKKEDDVDVIDALFALKPRLKKKYKGDREAFRKDLIDAAEFKRQARAIDKLDDLLEIEL